MHRTDQVDMYDPVLGEGGFVQTEVPLHSPDFYAGDPYRAATFASLETRRTV